MHTYIRHLFRLPGSTGSHNLLSEVKYRLKENSDCRSPTATEQPNTVIQGLCLGKIYGAIETGRYTYGRQTIFQQCFVTVGWVTGIGHPAYSKKISHQQSSSKILWKIFGGGIWSTWSNGRKNKPTVVLSCYLHQRRLRFHRRYFVRLHDDAKATQLAFARFGENLTHGPRKKRYLVIRITFR